MVIIVPPTQSAAGAGFYVNELDVTGVYTNLKGELQVKTAAEHQFVPGQS